MIKFPLPLLGFCAYSGTGKTTLLTKLLPLLKREGLRVGMVKHAHHRFDIDHPGKDSYELRKAGAEQMLVASRRRMALVMETGDQQAEPHLEDALGMLALEHLDLVLVEGFKQAAIAKIELHRPSLGKPLMYPEDRHIIAIASDEPLELSHRVIAQLDLNRPEEFVRFILEIFIPQRAAIKTQEYSHAT
jgi:molybdopterin-guanine dinucleotide biosynthesis protein MobB